MANSVDPDRTAIGAVKSPRCLLLYFNSSVMLVDYFSRRCIFLCALRVKIRSGL